MQLESGSIGIFDSGVGGLSVLRHIRKNYPHEAIIYLADQARVPYGSRSVQEIREYSAQITRFLLEHGAKIIVVACNTATAAALTTLRHTFPSTPFVGMEPAVKPAAMISANGKVGVLATPTTFASPRYGALMDRYAAGVTILEDPCIGLVELIEKGRLDAPEITLLLRHVLRPMLDAGADTIVLGCTHYPLVLPQIEAVVSAEGQGRQLTIVDPAPAVARQVGRILDQNGLAADSVREGTIQLYTTADNGTLGPLAQHVLGQQLTVTEIDLPDSDPETAGSPYL